MNKKNILIIIIILIFAIIIIGCVDNKFKSREKAIPNDAVKVTPEIDQFPPKLHSNEYNEPIPLYGSVNTAGAEDSPFIPCCKEDELYFFFTPDVDVPVEKQLIDGVTGIYVSKKVNEEWNEVERVILQDPWKLSLDGCAFIQDNIIWFCSARQGYIGVHWFTAEYTNGKWSNWQNADFEKELEVGELHFTNKFMEIFYHSSREGGKGGTDIWFTKNVNGTWIKPINIEIVNSEENEGYPYISTDGSELWFTKQYLGTPAIFRSKKIENEWQKPELIISQFAGEPTLDDEGNIYFVHHFYDDGKMIEADIYVAYRK